jgi:uncharacterized protein (UPF0276 family)
MKEKAMSSTLRTATWWEGEAPAEPQLSETRPKSAQQELCPPEQAAKLLGLGIGWRPELALPIDRRSDLGFVEMIAESLDPRGPIPEPIERLRERGVAIVPHGISLSLGGAEYPDARRLERLAELATRLGSPLVSEHVAFVRAGEMESGHLLPVARTRESLDVVIANIEAAKKVLPVPLAVENIATLVEWPDAEMSEAEFLTQLVNATGVQLLLDLENVYANTQNHGGDAVEFLDQIPLLQIAYVHVAGGVEREGIYHDNHAAPVPSGVLQLVKELASRIDVPGIMLERDDHFPTPDALNAELDRIRSALRLGDAMRHSLPASNVC